MCMRVCMLCACERVNAVRVWVCESVGCESVGARVGVWVNVNCVTTYS